MQEEKCRLCIFFHHATQQARKGRGLNISPPEKVEQLKIGVLKPYPNNARTHSDEQVAQIARSIEEFGWTNPVLIDGDNGIIAGHGRVLAAKHMGLDTVPCIRLEHLTPEQARAYVIADNQLALQAGWDDALLSLELKALDADGFDLSLLGFGEDALDELMADVGEAAFPALPDGDREPFQQMTFTLHDDQAADVGAALDAAKAQGPFGGGPNENSNGNALARICEGYLARHGNG